MGKKNCPGEKGVLNCEFYKSYTKHEKSQVSFVISALQLQRSPALKLNLVISINAAGLKYRSQVTGYWSQVTCCRSQVTGHRSK